MPVRYNRDLVQTTIKAMKRIAEIKKRREHVFWKNRCVPLDCSEAFSLPLIALCLRSKGWPQPRKRPGPTDERPSQTRKLSQRNLWNQWPPMPHQYGRKSRSSPQFAAPSSLAKANRWVWTSTSYRFLSLVCILYIAVHPGD